MWASPETVRYTGGRTRDHQDTWFTLCRMRGMWDILGYSSWTVEDRETGIFLGECGFSDFMRGMTPDLSQWPEAGWAFAESAWGRGIATEAVSAMHVWFDENISGQSVCVIDLENVASQIVAIKCGYTFWQESEYRKTPINIYRRESA